MRISPTGKCGFTLVELVVVMIIITVLSAMTIPRMAGSWGSATVRTAARDLFFLARYAQGYAVSHRTRCQLVLDLAEERYRLEVEHDPQDAPGEFRPMAAASARGRSLGPGVSFEAVRIEPRGTVALPSRPDVRAITFQSDGQADAAIIIIAGETNRWTLRIAPHTGRPQLDEGRINQMLNDRQDLDD